MGGAINPVAQILVGVYINIVSIIAAAFPWSISCGLASDMINDETLVERKKRTADGRPLRRKLIKDIALKKCVGANWHAFMWVPHMYAKLED